MTDLIDRIDALVDEQMADGEPENGYDFDDPDFPKCPHCGRDWHGLRLTRRIQAMRDFGHFDPEYSYAADDSTVLCEGSDFIGPRRPPSGVRRDISMSIAIAPRAGLFDRLFAGVADELADALEPGAAAMRALWQHVQERTARLVARQFDQTVFWGTPRTRRGFVGGTVVFDEFYRSPAPSPPTPDITVEFGPQNWHYELQRNRSDQYWMPVSRWHQPIALAVHTNWRRFTAPDFPVPDPPGYDFTRYAPDDTPPRWTAPPPARHHTRPPATARRAPRRGRSRR